MPNVNNSPNMTLPVPVVSVEPGPQYAVDINSCMSTIDSHDHSSGKGVPITPNGLAITSDLPFGGNNATGFRSTRFNPQNTTLSGVADVGCLYESGVDLYYNDGSGNIVRLTQSGGISGTPGSITGLTSPASVTYVAPTFVFQSGVNIAGNLDGRNLVLRNSVASSKGLTLAPPSGMPSDYGLTLPALPGSQSFMTVDTAGNITGYASINGGISNANLAGSIRTTKIYTGDQIAIQTVHLTQANDGYTVAQADGLLLCDSSGGNFGINLPDTSGGLYNGYTVRFKKTSNDFSGIVITAHSGQAIDQGSSTILNTYEEALGITCNSDGNWNIVDRYIPSNWASISLGTSSGINSFNSSQGTFARRVGDSLEVMFTASNISVSANNAILAMPVGLAIDTGKIIGSRSLLGTYNIQGNSAGSGVLYAGSGNPGNSGIVFAKTSESGNLYLSFQNVNASSGPYNAFTANSFFSSGNGLGARITIPISGWGSP